MESNNVTQSKPKSLEEFMRREEEIAVFEEFKRTETGLHEGFKEHTDFDSQRLEFRTTRADQSLLKRMQEGLLSTLRSHEVDADLTTRAQNSGWHEIIHLYKQHIDDIDASSAETNRLRDLFRNGGDVAGIAAGLIRMIPDEKGLSILREGLGYLILVWQRYIQTRDKVVEVFAEVLIIISNFHSRWAIYRDDVRLHHAFDDFLSLIFDSLTRLIEILVPHVKGITSWTKRVFKRFTNRETEEVSRIGSSVNKACKEISLLFEQLSHERTADIQKTSQASLRETKTIRKSTHLITTMLMDIQCRLRRVEEQQKTKSSQPNAQEEDVIMMVPAHIVAAMQTGLYNIICEKQYAQYYGLRYPVRPGSRDLNRPPVIADKQKLMAVLNGEIAAVYAEDDLKTILRNSHSMQLEGLDRAHSLMSHAQFKEFMAEETQALLLIDGYCRADGIGRTSPLSVWCASFIAALKQSPSVVAVHFFCGLHTRSGRDFSGPLGLAKSLAGQMLAYDNTTWDTAPLYLASDIVERVEKNELGAICEIIKSLLLRLGQSKVVLCVIDNVCEFESTWGNWQKDLTDIFEALYSFIDLESCGKRIPLKVILTSAERSTHLAGKVKREELVSLHSEVTQTGHMVVPESARGSLLQSMQTAVPAYWTRSRQPSTDEKTEYMKSSINREEEPPTLENGSRVGSEDDMKL